MLSSAEVAFQRWPYSGSTHTQRGICAPMSEPNDPLSQPPASQLSSSSPLSTGLRSGVFYGPNGFRAGWRLLIFLAILSALFSVAAQVVRLLPHRLAPTGGLSPGATLFAEGLPLAFVLLATWIMAKFEGRTFADYGLPPQKAFGAKFWQGAIVGFASISALLAAMRLTRAFHLDGMALQGIELWKYAFVWAIVFVVVGLFEESFFRGYVLFALTTGIGFWPAAMVSSLAFGYVHHRNPGETWVGASAAALVGLLFCLLLRRTGNLWMPIGFHAAWDWGETYFYGVPDSGQVATGHLFNATFSGPQWLTGGTVGPEGSYLCIALLVALCFFFAVSLREARYPNPTAAPALRHAHPPIDVFHRPSGTEVG
jgi:uncharacterized protein